MRKVFLLLALLIIYWFSTISAKASTIALDISDPTTFKYTTGLSVRGWSFNVNSAVNVDSLGIWDHGSDGLVQSHEIAIWDTTTQTIISQDLLTNSNTFLEGPVRSAGQFRFKPLDTIVTLIPGQYTIGAYYVPEPDPSLQFHYLVDAAAVIMESQFNWLDGLYDISGFFVIPTNSTSSNYNNAYWGPNFKYSPVPELTTMLLLGIGLVGVAGAARRRKKV